jgi:hypothetical protein
MRINEIELAHSATFRAMIHIMLIPFVIFSIICFIDEQWSLLGSVLYILTISFLQWYRARLYPTFENIFRKDTFFEILGWSLVLITGSVVMLIFIIII